MIIYLDGAALGEDVEEIDGHLASCWGEHASFDLKRILCGIALIQQRT